MWSLMGYPPAHVFVSACFVFVCVVTSVFFMKTAASFVVVTGGKRRTISQLPFKYTLHSHVKKGHQRLQSKEERDSDCMI